MLISLVVLPIAGGIVCLLIPKKVKHIREGVALLVSLAVLVLAVVALIQLRIGDCGLQIAESGMRNAKSEMARGLQIAERREEFRQDNRIGLVVTIPFMLSKDSKSEIRKRGNYAILVLLLTFAHTG